jgi:NADH-quinone oxidoreductase subunit C
MTPTTLYDKVKQDLGLPDEAAAMSHGLLALAIPAGELLAIATRLKTLSFDMLLDVTAVDWPSRPLRFDVVHHFYSTTHALRLRTKTAVSETEPTIDSLVSLYGSAHFMERECHDMYGIRFRGNADLRPLLLYEGFVGHPLRKDYPKSREQPLVPYRN